MGYELECGVRPCALRIVIYGPEGIGKSTLAAELPHPVWIDIENGTRQLPVARMPRPTSWTMLMDEIRAVRDGETECSTLVVDTADAAETLCVRDLLGREGKTGIEDFGYGKGYTYISESFARLLDALGEIAERDINVVLISHAIMQKFERPDETGAFDRFELNLSKKIAPIVKGWADAILFCDYKIYVTTGKNGKAKASGGSRVIRTTHNPCWDAKNRFGLPDELPMRLGELPGELAAAIPDMRLKPAAESKPAANADAPTRKSPETPKAFEVDPRDSYPSDFHALTDLMKRDGVLDDELRRVVGRSGNFPEACAVSDYERGFVDYLVSQWPTMRKRVKEERAKDPTPID